MTKINCRCLTKPFKRFVFRYGDSVSEDWKITVKRKYLLKYINKEVKVRNGGSLPKDFDGRLYIAKDGTLNVENIEACNVTSNIEGLKEFDAKITKALNKEKSLAHSKVREYWLRRGPRLFLVMLFTIVFTILCVAFIKEVCIF